MLLICEAEESEVAAVALPSTIKAGFAVAQRLANMLSHGPLQPNKSVTDSQVWNWNPPTLLQKPTSS